MHCSTHSRKLKENPKKRTLLHITCSSSAVHKWKVRPSTQNIECSLVRSILKFALTHSSWIWSSAFVRSNGLHFEFGGKGWEPLPWKVSRNSLLVLKSNSLYPKTEYTEAYTLLKQIKGPFTSRVHVHGQAVFSKKALLSFLLYLFKLEWKLEAGLAILKVTGHLNTPAHKCAHAASPSPPSMASGFRSAKQMWKGNGDQTPTVERKFLPF